MSHSIGVIGLWLALSCGLFFALASNPFGAFSRIHNAAPPLRSVSAPSPEKEDANQSEYTAETIAGRVVWLADAVKRRYGISIVAEAQQRVMALETCDGELVPLVEDARGRAFRADARLREMNLQLLVRRYKHLPMVQVLRVFAVRDEGVYELDYWCTTCAIAMYELRPCDCCQGPVELRQRQVKGS